MLKNVSFAILEEFTVFIMTFSVAVAMSGGVVVLLAMLTMSCFCPQYPQKNPLLLVYYCNLYICDLAADHNSHKKQCQYHCC